MKLQQPKTYNVDRSNKLTLTNISDMQYAEEDKSSVNCTVVFKEFPLEPMPFTADKYDSMAHGREIYNDIVSGEFGEVADYVPPKDEEGEV
jgi:hypothetical protein